VLEKGAHFMNKSIGLALMAMLMVAGLGVRTAAPAHPSIDIVASNWKFTPATITIPPSEPTTLRLTSAEGVHGLKSDDLGIALTTIMPNKFATVTFTPKKAGTYTLHCAIVCGAGHDDMVLVVKVVQ
jgi:cytochrome c oxidase subunit 2